MLAALAAAWRRGWPGTPSVRRPHGHEPERARQGSPGRACGCGRPGPARPRGFAARGRDVAGAAQVRRPVRPRPRARPCAATRRSSTRAAPGSPGANCDVYSTTASTATRAQGGRRLEQPLLGVRAVDLGWERSRSARSGPQRLRRPVRQGRRGQRCAGSTRASRPTPTCAATGRLPACRRATRAASYIRVCTIRQGPLARWWSPASRAEGESTRRHEPDVLGAATSTGCSRTCAATSVRVRRSRVRRRSPLEFSDRTLPATCDSIARRRADLYYTNGRGVFQADRSRADVRAAGDSGARRLESRADGDQGRAQGQDVPAVRVRGRAARRSASTRARWARQNPVHHDPEAARAAGFRNVVAPPMFCVVYSAGAMGPAILDPELGINLMMMVHGGAGVRVVRAGRRRRHDHDRGDDQGPLREGRHGVLRLRVRVERTRTGEPTVKGNLDQHREGGLMAETQTKLKRRPGAELPALSVTPDKYVPHRYAGASGDFNPIHIDPEFAKAVGLPGNILHGLYSMAQVARAATPARRGRPALAEAAVGAVPRHGPARRWRSGSPASVRRPPATARDRRRRRRAGRQPDHPQRRGGARAALRLGAWARRAASAHSRESPAYRRHS